MPLLSRIYGCKLALNAERQLSLDQVIALTSQYKVVKHSDVGIGYVILRRERRT